MPSKRVLRDAVAIGLVLYVVAFGLILTLIHHRELTWDEYMRNVTIVTGALLISRTRFLGGKGDQGDQ